MIACLGVAIFFIAIAAEQNGHPRIETDESLQDPFPKLKQASRWTKKTLTRNRTGALMQSTHHGTDRRDVVDDSHDSAYVGPEVLVDEAGPDGGSSAFDEKQQRRNPRRPEPEFGYEWDRKMELLHMHNLYRSNVTPPSSDMLFMEWDEELSRLAQLWADTCQFQHGFPPNTYPGSIGQNLYMGWEPTGERALYLWYEEFKDYDFSTGACTPNVLCGHYTQMVWAESVLLGCAMRRCGGRKYYVVCHYSPGGNIIGLPPYLVGRPCTQCPGPEGGLCSNNLCITREQCSRSPSERCDCPLSCQNCGRLDRDRCRCSCPKGWDSLDCSKPCADMHHYCGISPGFPTVATCSMHNNEVAEIYCRKMCGSCSSYTGANRIGDECCAGMSCPPNHVLDLERKPCKCRMLCPGPDCYYSQEGNQISLKSCGSLSLPNVKILILYPILIHCFYYFFIASRSRIVDKF